MSHEDKELVVVEAPYYQGPEPLALREGSELTVYERVGSNSMPVTDERRLEQMRRERQGQSDYDQLPIPGAGIDDLNVDQIKREFDAAGSALEDDSKLESYDLAATVSDERIPTRAGLLLFGQNDFRRHVPDTYFRAFRYPGDDRGVDVIDREERREVPPLEAVDGVLEFIARNTGTAEIREGRRRRDIPHYSELVLRELLHNAVAHADYSEEGMHINVSIYSDRLEIDSPGQWMAGMSVEQLRSGVSKARNRAITNTMHDLGYIERRGSAWAKALEAEKEGYPLPEWIEPGPQVRVTVKPHSAAAAATDEAAPPRRRDRADEVFEFVRRNGESSLEEIANAIGVGDRQARRYVRRLEEEDRLQPTTESVYSPTKTFRAVEPGH